MGEKDKKIVELETKLAKSEKERELDNSFWKQECDSLQKQLHDLPKKIVEEVEKNFTEYLPLKDKTGAGFYCRLNAILKKFGGKDESNND